MKPIVSIVTPSYNQGNFIERTIQSILSQEGNFFIDYIIQDSRSTDQSIQIIKKYEGLLRKNCTNIKKNGLTYFVNHNQKFKYNHCLGISYRWESKKDKGQVDALLKGFAICRGSILNWLNSDDVFYNDQVFNRITTLFIKDPKLDLISADGNLIDKEDKIIGQMIIPKIDLEELLYLDYHVLQPSTFFTKKLYDQNKQYLDINMTCAFDANFFTHIYSQNIHSLKLKEILSCYRFYPGIKTLSLAPRRFQEQMQVTRSISRNPFLFLLSYIYRYFEIILRFKTINKYFQSFFLCFKKFSYLIVTGKTDRQYEK